MLLSKTKQKSFKIGPVTIGGELGENPTVLIGSIFYHGQKIVENEREGIFNKRTAEELINRQDEFSDKTGNPSMIDVVCPSKEAVKKYIDFVASVTDSPILIDGVGTANKIFGLEYAKESGLLSRVIYNSLSLYFENNEIDKIKQIGLESSILLALNSKDFSANGRVKVIDELLNIACNSGISKPLIDTCVFDLATLGQACWSLVELKKKYGLPIGCGAHNATSNIEKRLKKKYGERSIEPCIASPNIMAVSVGADFIFYGPIENSDYIFPAVAMVDAAYGQSILDRGIKLEKSHPRFKILKE